MYLNLYIDEHEFNTPGSFGHTLVSFIDANKKKFKDHYEINLGGDHYFPFKEYYITNLNNIGDIAYGNTIIELKNELYSQDYSKSMHSGHLDNQMDDMFENEDYSYKYLFVLGNIRNDDYYFCKLQAKHIIGRTFNDSSRLMGWIFYTLWYNNSSITPHVSFSLPKYHPAWSFLKNINGVGRKKAEAIVRTLHYVTSLEDLMNLTTLELQTVKGIGSATANLIYDYIHNNRPTTFEDLLNNPDLRKSVWSELGGTI